MTPTTRRPRLSRAVGVVVAVGTLALTGCTGEDDPGPNGTMDSPTSAPTTGAESTESTPTEPELTDRSDLVLGYESPTDPLGEVTGAVDLGRRPATLKVYAVEAAETTTRLIYQVTSTEGRSLEKLTIRAWEQMPMLDDTAGGKRYYVNTFDIRHIGLDAAQLGVYLPPNGAVQTYAPLTAQYPPLSDETTSVDVTMAGFDPVTVPVTRVDN